MPWSSKARLPVNSIGTRRATWYRIGHDTTDASAPDGRTGTGGKKYHGTEVRNPYGDGWRTLDWRMNWRGLAGHDISAVPPLRPIRKLNSQTFFSMLPRAKAGKRRWHGPDGGSRGKIGNPGPCNRPRRLALLPSTGC